MEVDDKRDVLSLLKKKYVNGESPDWKSSTLYILFMNDIFQDLCHCQNPSFSAIGLEEEITYFTPSHNVPTHGNV
jgi:hypothetical protein